MNSTTDDSPKEISIHLMGGLGNQLFQIFNTLAYGIRFERIQEVVFPLSDSLKTGIERPTYWNTLYRRLKDHHTIPEEELYGRPNRLPLLREPGFHYTSFPNIPQSFMFYGYFQSHKYFLMEYPEILKMLDLQTIKEEVLETIRIGTIDFKNTISLHFRVGDYQEKQQFHPVMPLEYYIESIRFLESETGKTDWTYLYFYEEDDQDIIDDKTARLQETFPHAKFQSINHQFEDWEQLLIMSSCTHNIIANSSYSWWGGFLNENPKKKVCYPGVWFGPSMKITHTRDLFPEDWIRIEL